jgi:U6 snRNA-associated Sm-like protein LSm1|eukprot:TRINITY_DN9977_c0_g2_i1.p2 TRINITY_DN9977_c0_g2~~TRINITY_DN9977_c0_g2_i1.p2  ORF type:complete len:127 (+),score=53.61 TRINITY_DN9977_c0_g2_i1:139-519(+)
MQSIHTFLDRPVIVVLRDGRKLLGQMSSYDQFANVVLTSARERIHVGDVHGDIPLGLYIVRGENVVLVGELDGSDAGADPSQAVSAHEIVRLQATARAEKEELVKARRRVMRNRGMVVEADELNLY